MSETWRDISEYEGLYQVSNLGRVKSLTRTSIQNHKLNEITLKPGVSGNGYLTVVLHKKNNRKTFQVHQLVAVAFLNHVPCGFELVVNHIDINPLNNNVNNLEIVTARENSNKKHLKSSSKYVGVSWHGRDNNWSSSIRVNGKKIHLGSFNDELKAHEAYQNKLKQL